MSLARVPDSSVRRTNRTADMAGHTSRANAPSRCDHRLVVVRPTAGRCSHHVSSPEPPIDLQAARSGLSIGAALRRASEVIGLGIIPVAMLVWVFVVGMQGGPISGDFHHELYPEAKLLLQGENPFPSPDARSAARTSSGRPSRRTWSRR